MAITMPRLGLGTWTMGGKFERDESNRAASVEALRNGLEIGFRLIDTAEVYGGGLAEEIIGEAIKEIPRKELFLVSKVWKEHLAHNQVIEAAKKSLQRLRTDYLDLYLIHAPGETIPLSETMPAMEVLVEQGLVRAIGVSNFSVSQMEEARKYLRNIKISANQIEYNLVHREAETEIIPYCREHDITIMAHRPLAKGLLTHSQNQVLNELAEKYKKTPPQIALNWIMSQGHVAIPKAMSLEHLRENWGALGWQLEPADVALLSNASF